MDVYSIFQTQQELCTTVLHCRWYFARTALQQLWKLLPVRRKLLTVRSLLFYLAQLLDEIFLFSSYTLNFLYSGKFHDFSKGVSLLKEFLNRLITCYLFLHVEILFNQVVLILFQSYPFENIWNKEADH